MLKKIATVRLRTISESSYISNPVKFRERQTTKERQAASFQLDGEKAQKCISSFETSTAKRQKLAKTSRSKPISKTSRLSSVLSIKSIITASQSPPLVVGNTYLKVESIDLEKLLVKFFFFFLTTKQFLQ